MYLGVNEENKDPDPTSEQLEPWYRRPVDAIVGLLGNVSYVGDDYTVSTDEGKLLIDMTGTAPWERVAPGAVSTPAAGTPPTDPFAFVRMIPQPVLYGGAVLLALALLRR